MDLKKVIFYLSLVYSSTSALEEEEVSKETQILQAPSCNGLSGWWQADSNSLLHVVEEPARGKTIEFEGVYYTVDPKSPGALPGKHPSQASIRGSRSKDYSNSFGFVVSHKEGGTGVWVGQCLPGQRVEHLETVWLFRTPSEYEDQWSATRVGKDKWVKIPTPKWYSHE